MGVISFPTDPEIDKALAELTEGGASPSEAIRNALLETARRRRHERLREDAERAAVDPDYLAEVERVQEDLRDLRSW